MRLAKVKISLFTISYIFLALISNRLLYLSIYYFIGLIHELFHFLTAKSLNVHVDEMVFYPFGFVLKMNSLIYEKEWKQYLILISGPISFFFSCLLIKCVHSLNIISVYMFNYGMKANLSVLIINLLPIYPLDGEKIIENMFSHFLDEYKLRIFRIIISVITLFICIYIMFSLGNLVSFLFLLYGIISSLLNLKKEYILYLIKRLNLKKFTKQKIVRKSAIYRFYDNNLFRGKKFENEEEIIKKILKKEKIAINQQKSKININI